MRIQLNKVKQILHMDLDPSDTINILLTFSSNSAGHRQTNEPCQKNLTFLWR